MNIAERNLQVIYKTAKKEIKYTFNSLTVHQIMSSSFQDKYVGSTYFKLDHMSILYNRQFWIQGRRKV